MAGYIGGLGSGLDTASIVSQLMSIERAPQNRLAAAKVTALSRQTAWNELTTQLTSLASAAKGLAGPDGLAATSISTSSTGVLTATSTGAAAPGGVTVRVLALASGQQIASGGFASTSAPIGAGSMTVSDGLATTGLTGLSATDAGAGAHTVAVTRASSGATTTGTALAASTTIDATNDQLALSINGASSAVTLTRGTYTRDQLVSELQSALGPAVRVGLSGDALTITTAREGSTASIAVGGGARSADAVFGLAATTPVSGTDAQVSVDGTSYDVSTVEAGAETVVGGFRLTTSGHLSVGSAAVAVGRTSSPTATLTDLASSLNTAIGGPASAAVIDRGSGTDPASLVLSASGTGAAHRLTVATEGLAGFGGGFSELSAGRDAQLSFGSLTVTRPSNTVTDLLPGVTLNLVKADPETDVTVTVTRDTAGMSGKVRALVDAANGLLGSVGKLTKYDVTSKRSAALVGETQARQITSDLYSAMSGARGGPQSSTLGMVGVELQRDGTYAFDEAEFTKALAADPDGVEALIGSAAAGLTALADPNLGAPARVKKASTAAGEEAARIQTQVDVWDERLTSIEARYQRQFAQLETAMASLTNQGTWLSGQLAGLPSWS